MSIKIIAILGYGFIGLVALFGFAYRVLACCAEA